MRPRRLAWFSPFPPARTGIAGRSAELVERLRALGNTIDVYVASPPRGAGGARSAHEFVWRRRLQPYDLTVYQFGNSSHHDYVWPYALRYPGLVVLHDTRLHHARAAALLRERRVAQYRAEFAWNEPGVAPDLAELAIAGFDSPRYYDWPMVRALVRSARLVAVHGEGARRDLLETLGAPEDPATRDPDVPIVSIRMGEGIAVTPEETRAARSRVREALGITDEAVLFGCFGGLTPEKRIPQILAAFAALMPHAPSARLLLAGASSAHYDVAADIAAHGLGDRVILRGYLETDAELTDSLAACDVSLNLRWPTARETSGPWLRALAAARPTVIMDLAHLGNVPSLDPRTWRVNALSPSGPKPDKAQSPKPVCVAIDILDEDHSLRLAVRRLAADPDLRASLGQSARAWWARGHSVDAMVEDYARVIEDAAGRPDPRPSLPAHMRDDADTTLRALLAPFGIESVW